MIGRKAKPLAVDAKYDHLPWFGIIADGLPSLSIVGLGGFDPKHNLLLATFGLKVQKNIRA